MVPTGIDPVTIAKRFRILLYKHHARGLHVYHLSYKTINIISLLDVRT